MQKKEKWCIIKSFPDYAVSDKGRIKRITPYKTSAHKNKNKILKTHLQHGYVIVTLMMPNGKWSAKRVSRLVCEAFHGAPPSKSSQAAHIDGNRKNNHCNNLKWKTPKENNDDKYIHKTLLQGEKIYNSKLNEVKVREIRAERLKNNTSWAKLSGKYGISVRAIRDCYNRRTWKHII